MTPPMWWRDAVVYQVYPRSYADSDGDGIGDLPGITSRLDHLAELGVDAIWLSPFYVSPQHDAGYDVADYRDVDPIFGKLDDADTLVAQAHARNIRVIIDLVPNHTSSSHPWFRAALAAAPGAVERRPYIFRDGRGPDGTMPPNSWQSVFGGPAWTRVPDGQWYLHLFDTSQPDLDWEYPPVREEFDSILRFWFDRGVDGVRIDVAHGMVKAPGLPDLEPHVNQHIRLGPQWDQDGVHDIFRRWRAIADSYPEPRVLVAEAWVSPPERLARYVRPDELHLAFNFEYLLAPWRASDQRDVITRTLAANGTVGATTTWVLSNHDVIRHPTRLGFSPDTELPPGIGLDYVPQPDEELGLRRARAATMLMLGLPGSSYLYQGEELGLPEDIWLPDEARQDPQWTRTAHVIRGRDGCRVPVPWVAPAPSYGFGPGPASWLPQPAAWARYALDQQRGVAGSTYELYRSLLRLRRELGLGTGSLDWVDLGQDTVAFRNGSTLVVANLGPAPLALPAGTVVHLSSGPPVEDVLPPDTTIWAS